MASRWTDHFGEGPHADRPAATDVPEGFLWSCSDHGTIYQAASGAWTSWFTPSSESLGSALFDSKGDLLVASADDTPARLPVGADGQVLTADSAEPLGVKWVTPTTGGGGGGGGAGDAVLIDYTTDPAAALTAAGVPADTVVFMKRSGGTVFDFRNLSALPAGWTRQGLTSEVFDANGMKSPQMGPGKAWLYDLGGTTDVTLIAKINASVDSAMEGLGMVDTGGNGSFLAWWGGVTGMIFGGLSGYNWNTSQYVYQGSGRYWPVWMKYRKAGSTAYASFSADGITYGTEFSSTFAGSGTRRIWIGSAYNASDPNFQVERVQIAGGGASGLLGWWDGSVVQAF